MMYGEDLELNIYKLNTEYLYLIQDFNCGNDEINKFLKEKALEQMDSGKALQELFLIKVEN